MNVAQLIKELQKMPQGAQVGFSAHDNSEWEVAGWIGRVEFHEKSEHAARVEDSTDEHSKDMFKSQPKKWVTLRC